MKEEIIRDALALTNARLVSVRSTVHSIGVILLLAAVMACDTNRATGPYFQDVFHPDFDEAIVYFYRDAQPDAPKQPDWIYAFDKIIRLDQGGYAFQIVPPGRYLISLRSKTHADELWFDFTRGQPVFLKWSYVTKGDGYESKLMPVDEAQALKELPGCRLMQLDPGGRP